MVINLNRKNTFLELLFGWIGAPMVLGYWILGGISYIWSIVIAAQESGMIAAVITFILPGVSQVYWTYKMWEAYSFDSRYVVVSILALLCYLISKLMIKLSARYA